MAVLKHAVCALTSFCYLRRMVKEERLALLGSVLYTFSAFTIVNTQFYHFLEVIAFFPLILLGMEDAMSDHPRRGLLALFCGLNTLTNYYFMLSSALLAALYFVFRFFSADWKPRRTFKNVFMLIFECGAGCALAGVLLVPSMLFMLSITRTGAGDTSVLMQHYSASTLLERLRALIMPIESNVVHAYYGDAPSWASTAAYLPLFGLTGAVSAFAQKKSRWLRGLLLALAVCCVVPVLCGAFALETNISYTRWWYGLALMLTLVTLTALEDFDARTWRTSFLILTALTALLTVPFMLPENWLNQLGRVGEILLNRRTGAYASAVFRVFSLSAALLGGGAMLFILCKKPRFAVTLALTCAVAVTQYAGYIAVSDANLLSGGETARRWHVYALRNRRTDASSRRNAGYGYLAAHRLRQKNPQLRASARGKQFDRVHQSALLDRRALCVDGGLRLRRIHHRLPAGWRRGASRFPERNRLLPARRHARAGWICI